MSETTEGCWVCDSTDILYTDALGMDWCTKCYCEIFLDGGVRAARAARAAEVSAADDDT